jgi:NitT/TauT family transport system permease protein
VIFGFGFSSRILVCVIISIFPIVSNTLFGLLSAERSQHDLFTLHDASRRTRLLKLQLPAALPAIFTGYRIAAGLSVIGAVVGELFFRRGSKGIGILMDQYRSRNQYPLTYGALVLSSLLGIAVFVFFGWLGHAIVGRWHESTRKSE